jgi:hypothetical protein
MGRAGNPEDSLLMAAIGPNWEIYLQRWRQMAERNTKLSWNWPACLLNVFWFAYRKMWVAMGVTLFAIVLLSALGAGNPTLGKVMLILTIGISFVTGTFGNQLYRQQIDRLVADTATLPPPERVEALQKRGGVSNLALYVLIGVTVVLTTLAVLATAQKQRRLGLQPAPVVDNGFAPAPAPYGQNPSAPDPNAVPQGGGEKPPVSDEEVQQSLRKGY